MTPRSAQGLLLSLIVPMHNEAEGLEGFFARIETALSALPVRLEIVCIDDGSQDDTYGRLAARAATDPRLKLIRLSRNFGKEAAMTAGLDAAAGDLVVPLDADLQDPPELITEFIRLWEQGYDVVYGVRTDRASDTPLKRLTSAGFYRLFNTVSDHSIPASTGDFRLMDRQVVDALNRLPERNRFMKGLFSWVGFTQVGVPYARPPRAAGTTSWGYLKLWRFAIDGMTAFSTVPLRVWSWIGLFSAFLAILFGSVIIIRVLLLGRDVPGYASIMVTILFGFALQMIALGVMGEYVARMFQEVKGRPIYVVRDRAGFEA